MSGGDARGGPRQAAVLPLQPYSSGISVLEIPARGQPIPVARESVTAFIGPAPRGPVDIPVAIRSLEEFLARFGVPGYLSRMEFMLYQYFENGGTLAIVVRVCGTGHRSRITLPGEAGELLLDARNPGPLEYLRAAVDYDNIDAADTRRFNLVIHRCRSPSQPLVEEQEIYQGLSVEAGSADFIADVLAASALVRLAGEPPPVRPAATAGGVPGTRYVYSRGSSRGDEVPSDYDLIGSPARGSGLFALEQVPWVDFICLVPGSSGATLGPVVLFAADRYCRQRQALLLLDPPGNWSRVADVIHTQRERGFTSPNALTYFPALENPPHAAPVGHLSAAGAIAGRLCAAGLAPAEPLPLSLGRTRPACALDEGDVHQLAQLGVNALLRGPPAAAIGLAGLVTLARSGAVTGSWNDLRRRRTALFVLGSVLRHTRWAAFEQPGPALWQEVRMQVDAFLRALQARGLLAADAAGAGAFYVKCDADTHAGSGTQPGRLVLVLGLALARPGEFAAFRIRHEADGSSASELGWQPGLALAC